MPNFDAEKFLTITGVDVREPETHTIIVDGREIQVSRESWLALKKSLAVE